MKNTGLIHKRKKSHPVVMTGVVAALIYIAILVRCGITPFGDNTLLTFDGNDQLLGFYGFFGDILRTKGNLFYSFSQVLGGDSYVLAAYYLMSPFNLLLMVMGGIRIPQCITLITGIKYVLMAMSCCVALGDITDSEDSVGRMLFSISYGFMGFVISFFMILSWMDALILLPLIFAGLKRLVDRRGTRLYILCLGLAIISNYYIGFMLCVGSVLFYFLLVYAGDGMTAGNGGAYSVSDTQGAATTPGGYMTPGDGRTAGNDATAGNGSTPAVRLAATIFPFIVSSALAGGIGAIVLVPVARALPSHRFLTKDDTLLNPFLMFNPTNAFTKFLTGTTDGDQVKNGLPMLFIGILALTFLILFFFNKKVSGRLKRGVFAIFLIIFASFVNSSINYIWHGVTSNYCYNYRYSFLLCFLGIVAGYICFINADGLGKSEITRAALLMTGLWAISVKSDLSFINVWAMTLDGFFVLLILLSLWAGNNRQDKTARNITVPDSQEEDTCQADTIPADNSQADTVRDDTGRVDTIQADTLQAESGQYRGTFGAAALVLFSLICIFNLYHNAQLTITRVQKMLTTAKASEYNEFYKSASEVIAMVPQDGTYRTEKGWRRNSNDHMLFSLHGVSNFTSTCDSGVLRFMGNLGYRYAGNYALYESDAPDSADSLFGIRYVLTKNPLDNSFKFIKATDEWNIYENPNALPLMMVADRLYEKELGVNAFEDLNSYYHAIVSEEERDIFTLKQTDRIERVPDTDMVFTAAYKATWGENNYIHIPYGNYDMTLTVNGESRMVNYTSEKLVYRLGSYPEGTELEVELVSRNDNPIDKEHIVIYGENTEVLKAYCDAIKGRTQSLTIDTASHLTGSVELEEASYVLTTIPYSMGWLVRADGQEVPRYVAMGRLLALYLPAGEHSITMDYKPSGFIFGAVISVICLIAALFTSIHQRSGSVD